MDRAIVVVVVVVATLASAASSSSDPAMADAKSSVSLGDVTVTEGGSASLPCDMSLPAPDDAIYLVVWFLEPNRKPIYTFDARGKPLSMGRRWSEVASFGLRADFRFALTNGQVPSQGYLVINSTALSDEGIYRCRVDFKKSPARHYRVFLNVTVPPSEPVITDENGREIRSAKIGPLQENQSLTLHCHVTGGKPAPKVEWLVNGRHYSSLRVNPAGPGEPPLVTHADHHQLYGNDIDTDSGTAAAAVELLKQLYVSEVRIGSLGRSFQDARVTCRASNTENGPARAKTLTIDVQLPPLKADIVRSETRFVFGETSEIRCQTYGSRPSASITWWIDNIRLPDSAYKVFDDAAGNMTTSVLRINLTKEDHGKMLTCRAFNRLLDGSAIEDFLRLDVQFPPEASLRLGPTLKPETIKEGDDVYFECAISANPDVTKLIWKHEDRLLVYNASAGVIMANQSLVLRGLTRQHSGDYRCIGINARGEGVSNPVALVVRYSPLCRQPLRHIRGAERGELVDLTCAVDSLPRPTKYRWALNGTRGWRDVAGSSGSSSPTSASLVTGGETLRFRPELEADFGTVACWAYSDLGWQQDPCLFRFFPAGPPESLINCSVLNQTADSIHVSCLSNDDGGLKQSFQLQAMDMMTGQPQLTLQTEFAPEFWLTDLEPGSTFTLYLYAANAKGLSAPVVLPASTLKEAAKRTVPPNRDTFSSSVVGVVATGAGVGLLLIGSIAVVACLRCRRSNDATSNTSLLPAPGKVGQVEPRAKSCPANGSAASAAYSNGDGLNLSTSRAQSYEENGGFHRQSAAQPAGISSQHPEKRACLKVPPAFVVNMSDVPESCV